jgi:hypothetical protein
MRLPHYRLRTLLIAVAILAVVCGAFSYADRALTSIWMDQRVVPIRLIIVDAATGRAIPDAAVTIYDVRGARPSTSGSSGRDGRVTLLHPFTVIGTRDLLGRRDAGRIDLYSFWCIEVKARGYRDWRSALSSRIDPEGPADPPTIALDRGAPPGTSHEPPHE